MEGLKEYVLEILNTEYPNEVKDANDRNQVIVYSPQSNYHGLILDFSGNRNNINKLAEIGYCVYNIENFDDASEVIYDYFRLSKIPIQHSKETVKEIMDLTSQLFGVKPIALLMKGRSVPVVGARHLAMYIMKKKFFMGGQPMILEAIGKDFGRDHASVLHAIKSVSNQLETSSEYRQTVIPLLTQYGVLKIKN